MKHTLLYHRKPSIDVWVKIHPRHQIIHLLPANEKRTVCGIPNASGVYIATGKTRKCAQCEAWEKATLTKRREAYTKPRTYSFQLRRIIGLLITLLAIAIVGYTAVRFLLDWSHYNSGHHALQQADCTLAINHYDSIIYGWRLIDIGGYSALAQQEKNSCPLFQLAVDKQQAGEYSAALAAYADLVSNYSHSALVEVVRNQSASLFDLAGPPELASQESCDEIDTLLEKNLIPLSDVNLPLFYFACGQVYDTTNNQQGSFVMYKSLLMEYPNHSLAGEAKEALWINPLICEETVSQLKDNTIDNRTDLLPRFYYLCGQAYEEKNKRGWANAIVMYENFLVLYPNHSLAPEVEVALAQLIVAQANAVETRNNLPVPERTGRTGNKQTEVVIQNDSPHRLRIVFSGPESRVEELEACDSCRGYIDTGPTFCLERGPIGRYTLQPGQYDIVVNTIGDSEIIPWKGNWSLTSGDEYFSCFYVVITIQP